jgi:hypothetical protein
MHFDENLAKRCGFSKTNARDKIEARRTNQQPREAKIDVKTSLKEGVKKTPLPAFLRLESTSKW